MTPELWWIYAFNVIVNSLLSFLTVALEVSLVLFIFRIKPSRFKAFVLCIPILKLVLDLFLYNFSDWAFFRHLDPHLAAPGERNFNISIGQYDLIPSSRIFFSFSDQKIDENITFTIADLISYHFSSFWLKTTIISFFCISLTMLGLWIYRFIKSAKEIQKILKSTSYCYRPIFNLHLLNKLRQTQIEVLICDSHLDTPCAIGIFKKKILFPKNLIDHLSQEEFEAIIAHEMNHLRWYDSSIRMVNQTIKAIFWWIPVGLWQSHLEHTQELVCDREAIKFNISSTDMAAAIVKTAKYTKTTCRLASVTYFIGQHSIYKRIQAMIKNRNKRQIKILVLSQMLVATYFLVGIAFGNYFIF